MASSISMSRLLGFGDFFPNDQPKEKTAYAQDIGKELIQTFCCHFLGLFKFGSLPPVPLLVQNWFTYMGRPFFSSPSYWHVIEAYNKVRVTHDNEAHNIISEESLLNLFLWTVSNQDIPDKVENIDASVMLQMFNLNLLFNDDVLINYQKAVDSAKRHDNLQLQRMFLATSFPQSDIINVDYAQLMYTQFYKFLLLLNFLESTGDYNALYKHLLQDFKCNSRIEFVKALSGAIFMPFQGKKPGWSALVVDKATDPEKSTEFLDKLTISPDEATVDQNDFLRLRDKPFQLLENGEYRIVFDLFLVKKLYNGIIFKLSDYSNKHPNLFKGFLGRIRDEFSEAVLVYDTLSKIFKVSGANIKTGNEFKAAGIEREPDFYAREGNTIMLFESKDFYMPGPAKLSYDFAIIEAELRKDGRLGKAVKQLAKNVERAILRDLLDTDYDPKSVEIAPIVIVHDSLYSTSSLNYWVNSWFNEEVAALRGDERFAGFDFSRVLPVTLVEIDTLILYLNHFQSSKMSLTTLVRLYQEHVKLNLEGDQAVMHIFQSMLPFSEFVRDYGYGHGIVLNTKNLVDLYQTQ